MFEPVNPRSQRAVLLAAVALQLDVVDIDEDLPSAQASLLDNLSCS